jgi:hypothetical protein
MRNRDFLLTALIVTAFAIITATGGFRGVHPQGGQNDQRRNGQQPDNIDLNNFPLLEYQAVLPTEPSERLTRQAKSKKYNGKHAPRITEATNQIFDTSDWDLRLPALPVTKSTAVVVGEITRAQAYLSEDQTNIYSEFNLRVDQVLKNDDATSINIGDKIVIQRKGGRVRFPSGKIAASMVNHQDMPLVNRRYVVFLTHSFPMGGLIEDFYLLTAYELCDGRVYPLDKPPAGHPIAAYKGIDETSFLNDLQKALIGSELPSQ